MNVDETNIERRKLLVAAAGVLGTLTLPGCILTDDAQASPTAAATPKTIMGGIDVAQALADGSLVNNQYWFDTNVAGGSTGMGSGALKTVVNKGDTVTWVVSGLEVETLVDIVSVSGTPALALDSPGKYSAGYGNTIWSATIPADTPSGVYAYQVTLNLENKPMTTTLNLTVA